MFPYFHGGWGNNDYTSGILVLGSSSNTPYFIPVLTMNIPCRHLNADTPKCEAGQNRRAPMDCPGCTAYDAIFSGSERTLCELWSRVMGYFRPVSSWNTGKQSEFAERKYFRE